MDAAGGAPRDEVTRVSEKGPALNGASRLNRSDELNAKGAAMKNIMSMMKQAQELQSKMAEMQAELEALQVEGASGGGLVRVTLTGKGAMARVAIDASLMKPEDVEILEDLMVAAHNDAKQKAEHAMAEKMQALTGGLPLPPGLKLF
jgi:DNA-binding YbaB/EbfC family protein